MIENCDMCGSKIIDKKCSCGTWQDRSETQNDPMFQALEQFHDMSKLTFTGDAPYLGCAVIFFRGDYNDCKIVEKFILQMKNRPFYKEDGT